MDMMWKCDVCHVGNVCDVSTQTHLFAAILIVKRDHERLNPSCEWSRRIFTAGCFITPGEAQTLASDADHRRLSAGPWILALQLNKAARWEILWSATASTCGLYLYPLSAACHRSSSWWTAISSSMMGASYCSQ
jgi:hypothetical protein